jgi:hypothetical protein
VKHRDPSDRVFAGMISSSVILSRIAAPVVVLRTSGIGRKGD